MIPLSRPFIFLDEGGNLDFSSNGTKYFTLTALTTARPFLWESALGEVKYDLLEEGIDIEYFHATEDKQGTHDRVFAAIAQHLSLMRIHSLIIEKRKTRPALQPDDLFYPRMLAYLLKYIFKRVIGQQSQLITVMTDQIPHNKRRDVIEKEVKTTLSSMIPGNSTYQILHHASKSCATLQVVDYCNWAIYRKWANGDTRSYDLISSAISSEYDMFQAGTAYYY